MRERDKALQLHMSESFAPVVTGSGFPLKGQAREAPAALAGVMDKGCVLSQGVSVEGAAEGDPGWCGRNQSSAPCHSRFLPMPPQSQSLINSLYSFT